MAAIEITANDVETAITQGLARLNLIRAEVKIEVLEDGAKGVLGIGARPAKVRLTPFTDLEPAAAPHSMSVDDATQAGDFDEADDEIEVIDESDEDLDENLDSDADDADDAGDLESIDGDVEESEIEGAPLAAELTQGVLDRMGLTTALCVARSVLPQDENDHPAIWVDIDFEQSDDGDADTDVLMSYQNEALNALQLLVQTMWSHRTKSSVRITLDVNGFRAKRQTQLQQMAERMADRVIANGKPITLEPMPANERRLVHMALRNHPQVVTESAGDGPTRKITIRLK